MTKTICYLGDDHLGGAAAYLAGIMAHFGMAFDYVPSNESPGEPLGTQGYGLYVLSDYPAARFQPWQIDSIVENVRQGAGLVMVGGWESFHGRLGEYHETPLAEVLPVVMLKRDDRCNAAQPCLVRQVAEHPILAGLPWDRPPGIGGFNAFTPKPRAQTLLTAVQFAVRRNGERFEFDRGAETPLLVIGQFGHGRSAALATDVAPHWVGGLVDWGAERIVQPVGEGFIEVGAWYARFFGNLLRWTMGEM